MSGADNIQFNNLERALSTDLNNTESVLTRTAADNLRFGYATQDYSAGSSMPSQTIQNVVLGGLAVTPSGGAGVSVSPGVLCQDSGSLVPVPGSLDSTYRIARLETATTVAALSPGSDTYYLLEAQMVEVVASSQIRDIFSPSTQTFVPTLVPKQISRTVQFQWKAGTSTNFPTPTGGDWVPIAGLFRPSAGGNVTVSQIYDMRPFPRVERISGGTSETVIERRSGSLLAIAEATSDKLASFRCSGFIGGQKVFFTTPDPSYRIVLDHASVTDPANSPSGLASGAWGYLYLVPWSALKIPPVGQIIRFNDGTNNFDVGGGFSKGVLVFSTVAPATQGTLTNGGTVTLPAPFSSATAAAGQALCVGAFKKSSTSGYGPQVLSGIRSDLLFVTGISTTVFSGFPTDGTTHAFAVDTFPKVASSLLCKIENSSVGGNALQTWFIVKQGGAWLTDVKSINNQYYSRSNVPIDVVNFTEIEFSSFSDSGAVNTLISMTSFLMG